MMRSLVLVCLVLLWHVLADLEIDNDAPKVLVTNLMKSYSKVGQENPARMNGKELFAKGMDMLSRKEFEVAAEYFFHAMIKRHQPLAESFQAYLASYSGAGKLSKGYVRLAESYLQQNDGENMKQFLDLAIQSANRQESVNSKDDSCRAYYLASMHVAQTVSESIDYISRAIQTCPDNAVFYYSLGTILFGAQQWRISLEAFREAYAKDPSLHIAYCNIVYLETRICEWTTYELKMDRLERIAYKALLNMEIPPLYAGDPEEKILDNNPMFEFFIEPHMTLAFSLPGELKLAIARRAAAKEFQAAFESPLAEIYKHDPLEYDAASRIRIGYLSADFKLKATSYLVRDMFRFHDRDGFEVHCFANTANSEPELIESIGADWRKDIENGCEHFHDVSTCTSHQITLLIRELKIHILVNMDGYSNNGIRESGVFPLQPAPIQVSFLVYVGTLGAQHIQYVVTDPITSPLKYEKIYSEKFLYMPQCFFINSHYHIKELQKPGIQARAAVQGETTFNLCNFNKHLKINPDTFDVWMRIIRKLWGNGKVKPKLLMLENPADSIPNILSYIARFHTDLVPFDSIKFLPFEASPFAHQKRIAENCDLVLDNPVYNAHTMAVDTLYGATPIITYGTDFDMGGRVVNSMLTHLDLTELIVYSDEEYIELAVELAENPQKLADIRNKLQDSIANLHPFWDTQQYVQNLETLFVKAYDNFLQGKPPQHIV